MPKDQFYHEFIKPWEKDIYDLRAQILSARREAILDSAHTYGNLRHKYEKNKFKSGSKTIDFLYQFGKFLPTNRAYEHMKQKLDLPWFHRTSQAVFEKQIIELNKYLLNRRHESSIGIGNLTKNEAEELRRLASKAFQEGSEGLSLGDPLKDSGQNLNFGPRINTAKPIHSFKLPHTLELND